MTRRYTRAEFEQVFNHMFGELMPGAVPQGIDVVSRTQRYQIGSRLQILDKVYHYALVGVGAAGLAAGHGAKLRNPQDIAFHGLPAAGAVAAGSWNLTITVGATDGPAQSGVIPANYLRGGTVIVRTAATNFNRGILGHPAAVAGALVLALDAPTPVAIIAGNQVEATASRYANVTSNVVAAVQWTPMVGIPTIDAIAGDYTWLQTWGPCCCIGAGGDGANNPGGAINAIDVYATGDGGLRSQAPSVVQQRIGYIISTGSAAGTQGAPFVMLQLDP